ILIVCMMTMVYTTVFIFFIPQLQPFLQLDSVVKITEKIEQRLSSTFNRPKQISSDELKTESVPDFKRMEKDDPPTYYIKATLNEDCYQIDGQMNVTIDNPGTETIIFYTYPYSWSPMKIKKVLLNGVEVTFSYDQKQLSIKNPKEEKELNFSIDFETPVP